MKRKSIVFTSPGIAELQENDLPKLTDKSVMVKTEYTVISSGTERANLMGMRNTDGAVKDDSNIPRFPRTLGYCGVGTVVDVGKAVKKVMSGDRVIIYFGQHTSYNVVPENKVIKITDPDIPMLSAAPTVICQISLGGVRMGKIEIGESVIVMGLGILVIYAVTLCRLNGAYPIIAADPNPERRQRALAMGADFVFDPTDPDFSDKVKEVTKGVGVKVAIEVSGAAIALEQVLECMARMGRVVLLGCTRNNDRYIYFYKIVHYKGVQILGAHTFVRPSTNSYKGYWTYTDDCNVILNLISGKRLSPELLIDEIHSPTAAPEVYERLANDKEFPVCVLFDWKQL